MSIFQLLFLINLEGDLDDLSKHNNGGTFHDGNTSKTFGGLEGVANKWLLRLEDKLGHFVGFHVLRTFGLLSTSFLSDFPLNFGHFDSGTSSTDESDRRVSGLHFTRVVKNLDLGSEVLASFQGGIGFQDHDITNARHVHLVKTFDVKSDVVTRVGFLDGFVVHFNGEDFTDARLGGGRSGEEVNFLSRFDSTLFDTASDDVTDTLDLVDAGNRHTDRLVGRSRRDFNHVVEAVEESVDVQLLFVDVDNVLSFPPRHLVGFFGQVVTNPSRNREDRERVLDERLFPSDLGKHRDHFVTDFVVTGFAVFGDVAVHLVDTNNELFDTQQVDQTGVLTSLSLDNTLLVVTSGNSGGKVTVRRNHEKSNIGLRSTRNHVLDEVSDQGHQ